MQSMGMFGLRQENRTKVRNLVIEVRTQSSRQIPVHCKPCKSLVARIPVRTFPA
jgi:hypothetical protein